MHERRPESVALSNLKCRVVALLSLVALRQALTDTLNGSGRVVHWPS
jgi:hypothetical protein